MHQEITRTLEKITSREKYINSQMEGPIAEYRRLKDRYSSCRLLDFVDKEDVVDIRIVEKVIFSILIDQT